MSETDVLDDKVMETALRNLMGYSVARIVRDTLPWSQREELVNRLTAGLLPTFQGVYEARRIARNSSSRPELRAVLLRSMRLAVRELEEVERLEASGAEDRRLRLRDRQAADPSGITPAARATLLELALCMGTNREVAERMHVGEATVKTHLRVLAKALGTENRMQLVRNAFRRGLLPRCPVCARPPE